LAQPVIALHVQGAQIGCGAGLAACSAAQVFVVPVKAHEPEPLHLSMVQTSLSRSQSVEDDELLCVQLAWLLPCLVQASSVHWFPSFRHAASWAVPPGFVRSQTDPLHVPLLQHPARVPAGVMQRLLVLGSAGQLVEYVSPLSVQVITSARPGDARDSAMAMAPVDRMNLLCVMSPFLSCR
jgi:hypothetical protein